MGRFDRTIEDDEVSVESGQGEPGLLNERAKDLRSKHRIKNKIKSDT